MNYILFHVPHSSLKIPKQYWNICVKDKKYIKNINIFLSDYLSDKLIPSNCHKLIFKYSRLFCDVEKFKDDSKEIMAKKGMGVILKSYYDKHHNKLDKIVTNLLKKYNKCIIIDFHSFSDEMIKKLFDINTAPDICIGVDSIYTDEKLTNITIEHFKKYGYSVAINNPYEGTIISNKYFNKKDKRLSSLMLEINKRVYLTSKNDFYKLKQCINDYYNKIQEL